MSSLLRNSLRKALRASRAGAAAPTPPLGLAVSAKRLFEVRSKVLECAHVGTLESTWRRPDLQNCIELVALLGRAHSVQQRFELSEGDDKLALSSDERKQLRIEALTNGAHPMDAWSADLTAVEQLFQTLALEAAELRGVVPESVRAAAAAILNGSAVTGADGGAFGGELLGGSTAHRASLLTRSGSRRGSAHSSRSDGGGGGANGNASGSASGGEREAGAAPSSAQHSVRWRVLVSTSCPPSPSTHTAHTVPEYERAGGVEEMQRRCIVQGFGGFAIVGSTCVFRAAPSSDILASLERGVSHSTLYVCERNAELLALGVGANGQLLPPIDPSRNSSAIALHARGGTAGGASAGGNAARGTGVGASGSGASTPSPVSSTGGVYIDPQRLRCSCRRGGDSVIAAPPTTGSSGSAGESAPPFGLPQGVGRWYYEVTLGGSQMAQIGWVDLDAARPAMARPAGHDAPHGTGAAEQRYPNPTHDPVRAAAGGAASAARNAAGASVADFHDSMRLARQMRQTQAVMDANGTAAMASSASQLAAMNARMGRPASMLDAGMASDATRRARAASGVSNVSDDAAAAMARSESEHGSESATPRTEVVQMRASARRSLDGAWLGFGSSAELASARVAATPSLTLLVGDDAHSWGVDLTRR